MARLSILISAYDNHNITVVHVRECMNSTLMPDEIIVVNDHGTPDLKDKLLKLDLKTKIVYAYINEDISWNYTGARNLAFWLSTGDFISTEDNDHIPTKDFYEEALNALEKHPEIDLVKTHKRWIISSKDVLNKPVKDWVIMGSRVPHQDVCLVRRQVYLKVKGYDERLAGAYGWSATDWRRRLIRANIRSINTGYQYVVFSEKGTGLSHRNYQIARENTKKQSPHGIINFTYEYEILGNKK